MDMDANDANDGAQELANRLAAGETQAQADQDRALEAQNFVHQEEANKRSKSLTGRLQASANYVTSLRVAVGRARQSVEEARGYPPHSGTGLQDDLTRRQRATEAAQHDESLRQIIHNREFQRQEAQHIRLTRRRPVKIARSKKEKFIHTQFTAQVNYTLKHTIVN
jgi:hypothetical protein